MPHHSDKGPLPNNTVPSFLDRILAAKREELAAAKAVTPQRDLELAAADRRGYRDFSAALQPAGVRIIAEIKRASPSRGAINPGLDPATTARAYEEGGAVALSVLTEPTFFKGSPADLQAARRATSLPVLRKEFVIDPYQLYETAAMGADAILLIVRILDDAALHALHHLACELGLSVLTEVFDENDVARTNAIKAQLVGINSRDLARFTTDLSRVATLAARLHPAALPVALSGIQDGAQISRYLQQGISRFLVGEALVRQAAPAATLRAWCSRTPQAQPLADDQ